MKVVGTTLFEHLKGKKNALGSKNPKGQTHQHNFEFTV